MKKKLKLLLLFITISFCSCNSVDKNPVILNSNINTDFPTSEKVDFKLVNEYRIFTPRIYDYIIDDSIMWVITQMDPDNFGYCFNLNTGKKLSAIVNKGRAANEFLVMYKAEITGDSIQFHSGLNEIKTFAKKDIIENKPMGERNFSYITTPDTVFTNYQIKLPNGSVLATIPPSKVFRMSFMASTTASVKSIRGEFNKKSVAIYNNNEVNSYETIKYDSFNPEKGDSKDDINPVVIKSDYSSSHIGIKGNDMAVFALHGELILYTFDLNSKKVVKEKRYGNITVGEYSLKDYMNHGTYAIKCNDKYIVCIVYGYFSKEDKELDITKIAILVFDWDLNPIKRIDLPHQKGKLTYSISEDCSAAYSYKEEEEGISLFKLDLNI